MKDSNDTVSLKEYVEKRFDASDKAISAALAAAEKAVIKAETAADKRFESVNEFRAALEDQQENLLTKNEHRLTVDGLQARLKVIEDERIARLAAGGGMRNLWGIIVGVVGFGLAILAYLNK